ncbi:MAG: hypothetical protein CSA95_03550 [Bacteroidetes bacterium]|nr:MAG: hypothetical protein CSA95_03550 [Bacteroidota bacterium]PIE88487.1 MAG: hypothetical protein CSA04_01695 [Bacteroidota bacterium]
MRMKKILWLFCLTMMALVGRNQTLLEEAVNIQVKDVDGNTYALFDILDAGKHVVIDFYMTGCTYCQLYAPHIQASYEHFGENGGDVFFMTIDKGSTNSDVRAFDLEYGITMPSISGLEGGGNKSHSIFEIQSTPTVILIAPDYTILEQVVWPPSTENIDSVLIEAGVMPMGSLSLAPPPQSRVWPNPSSGSLSLFLVDEEPEVSVHLFDAMGRKRFSTTVETHRVVSLNGLSGLSRGIYWLQAENHQAIFCTKKIVLQ